MPRRLLPLPALWAALMLIPTAAQAGPGFNSAAQVNSLCVRQIVAAERRAGIPAGLLSAIALAESGRPTADRSAMIAWPWTVMAEGRGRYFDSKAEAVAEAARLRAEGVRNIDVGCMQINLMYHPDAFATLGEAFDPAANVAYGARFLKSLRQSAGSWTDAVAHYHSQEPERGQAYRARVLRIWSSPAARAAVRSAAAAPKDAATGGGPAGPAPADAAGASLVARAALATPGPRVRPWAEVVQGRAKFADWLAQRQAERRAARDPS